MRSLARALLWARLLLPAGSSHARDELLKAAAPKQEIAPGIHMPVVSIGTWTEGARVAGPNASRVVASWLGSRLYGVDAAYVASNQQDVARALIGSGIDRSELFVTSKIPTCMGEAAARQLVRQDLSRLNTDYLDLMLVHAPYPDQFCPGTWRALERYHSEGKLKSIGVSNFNRQQLTFLMQHAKVRPAVNQVEFNAYSRSDDIEAFCAEHNITIRAWSPLGEAALARRAVYSDKVVAAVAKAHGVSPAQVALRWVLQRGHALTVLTGGAEPEGTELDLFGFSLSDEEVSRLNKLKQSDTALGGAAMVLRA